MSGKWKDRWTGILATNVASEVARVFRRAGPVAAAGYLVVALFGLSFLFVKRRYPALPEATATTFAALAAAPLALALVWHRLAGVKAFGIEVSLTESSVQTNAELVAAITGQQSFSGAESIVRQIRDSIVHGETEILEIDLKDGDYWWSTRLYLLAALADDLSVIQAFAFVERGLERKFLGLCTPSAVRRALAKAFPVLREVYSQVTGQPPVADASRVEMIVNSWTFQPFGEKAPEPDGKKKWNMELDVVEKVNTQRLGDWLSRAGQRIWMDSVEWSGISDPRLLQQIVTEYRSPYVALLREGRLDRIVNRHQLAIRIAGRVLKS